MAEKEGPTATSETGQEKKYAPIQHKPCQICEGKATGYHFGVISCEACKSFFRRSLKRKKQPVCEKEGDCPLIASDVVGIPCPACRLRQCVQKGMSENAVKKGRYSLDRRAEAILESRQYWTPGNQQKGSVKSENSSASLPDGACSSGSSGHDIGSGPPSVTLSSSANSLSADDVFTLLSEVCGDDIAKGCAVNDPISTINKVSLSSLLNDPTLKTNPVLHNIPSESESSSSSFSLQGQFTFRMEPSVIKPLHSINPDPALPPNSEIKNEFQTQRPGYRLSKPNQNEVSPTFHGPGAPQGSMQYTTGSTASFEVAGVSFSSDPIGRTSSEEPMQPVPNAASKHQSPEDMDVLCKLLLSDFKVKDDQDYIIDEIVAAFDRQNFTNKGFLSKISDQQHKYLEGQKEEERMFGPITKLNSHEFIHMFKETGVDIDGRLTMMQQHADVLDDWVKQIMQFYKGIPGFTDLPLKDQMHLMKGSKWEFATCSYFPHVDVHHKIEVSPLIKDCVVDMKMMKAIVDNSADLIDRWMFITERLQNLQITDREYTMMTALFVIDPDECVTEKGKEQCKQLAGKLDDAFRHLLKKRLSYDKTDEIMKNIKEIRELLRPISLKYNVEYFTSMKLYSEHCGVKYGELTWQYYEI